MKHFLSSTFLALSLGGVVVAEGAPAGSPVDRWGALHVEGTQLVAATGTPVALRGMSLFDTTSYGEYANPQVLAWLRDDWQATLFRAAMYTAYNGNFIGEAAYENVYQAVDAAVATGLYVLIDWHILTVGNPLVHVNQAKDFFTRMATRYAGVPNVIYEICNEPNGKGVTWADAVKPYALQVIPVIRELAPDAVILVGTPEWSSHPEVAAADPLPFDNLMYSLHFYAGSHDKTYLERADQARAAGVGVFVTEWGTTTAQVTGRPHVAASAAFVKGMADRGLSWANWSLGTKLEPSSAIKPFASTSGGWAPGDLTESGMLIRSFLREETSGVVFADNFDSGNFKAGGWVRDGVALERTVVRTGTGALRFEGRATMEKALLADVVGGWSWSFQGRGEGWNASDRLMVEWSLDGEVWNATEVQQTAEWTKVEGTLPTEADRVPTLKWRLRSDFASETARYWVDDVEVSGTRSLPE